MQKQIDLTTEKGCIEWVELNIIIFIRPKKVKKYPLISPFSSEYAKNQVVNNLGKELFKMLDEANAIKKY